MPMRLAVNRAGVGWCRVYLKTRSPARACTRVTVQAGNHTPPYTRDEIAWFHVDLRCICEVNHE